MRFDKKIVLRFPTLLLAAAFGLSLALSSCSAHRGAAAPQPTIASVSAPREFGSAVRYLKLGREAEAASVLERVRRDYPGTLWAARSSFLSGVLAVEKGEGGAIAMFDGAEALKGFIPDYLAFYRARSLALDGDHEKAISAIDLILNDYPDSPLVLEALFLRASSLLASGREDAAAVAFASFASDYPKSPLASEALLRGAGARLLLGQSDGATALIKKILVNYPADKAAEEIESLYAQIPADGAVPVPELTPAQMSTRARRLFREARFEDAAAEYALLSADPKAPFYDSSVIQRAMAMVRLKKYEEAASILDGYLKPGVHRLGKMERRALYWSALVSLRQGSERGLLKAVDRLKGVRPRPMELAHTLIFLGRHYESRGMKAEAAEVYTRVMEGFGGTAPAREAAWHVGWMHYRAGRFAEALGVFSRRTAPEPDGPPLFLYWSARSMEKLGDSAEAEHLYMRLCDTYPRDYYCRMAETRFMARSGPESPEKATLEETPPVGAAQASDASIELFRAPRYRAAMELLTMGLDARAASETALLAREYSKEPDSLAELAGLFYRAGDFHRAFRLYYSYLSGRSAGAPGLPDIKALSFPPRLVEMLRSKGRSGPSSAPVSVDPYLVAAVMREESGFNPAAVSSTGAMGLMQIMPSTGAYIAGKLGRGLSDDRELLDPDVNIELGSWYLGHLARRFDNDIVLTIASYNAGPGAVARWTETLPVELDEFIESIPFPETRRYAKKVLKSYGEFLRTDGVDPAGLFARPVLDIFPTGAEARTTEGDDRS